ncbi:hypothetical protein SM0020_28360 [Sinorhizobium meliloti CCNWSX0020]|uniref:Uncharacterized protein n=1 Tax=Sinorhizobium meliloti CCNWSX0020 TaxID=1107881 RepID=H0G837_RHIML|nr:hypothetical protein SM0020_28360 [Sinorhizobium meliloti CCNWSX0020]PII37639.1 hypothetical protein T190_30925 [Sinorhizobium meliloti CCBAU 01290]
MRVPARGDDTGTANRLGDLIADWLGAITIGLTRYCSAAGSRIEKVAALAYLGPSKNAFRLSEL